MKLLKITTEVRKPDGTVLFKEKILYPVIEEFEHNYKLLAINGQFVKLPKNSSYFEVVERAD